MRIFKPKYKDSKTGKPKPVRKWWIELRDNMEVIRRFPGCTDKKATEALGKQIERLVGCKMAGEKPGPELVPWLESISGKLTERLVKVGLLDTARAAAGKSISDHLKDFEQSLLAKGDTKEHVQTIVTRARRIIKGCGFKSWTDISANKVQRYLAELRNNEEGISAQTSNHYLQAIKQFCTWMTNNGRASESPVRYLKGQRILQTDKRHARRALEPEEIRRLLEVTKQGPDRYGMSGYERCLLYRLAIESGLRRKELQSLKVSSFDFKNYTVTVMDAYSKNRKQSVLPLRKDTAVELERFFAGKLPNVKAFGGRYKRLTDKTAKMLREDLAEAGIPYVDDGFFFDFHAQRHQTGTLLAISGTHPKVAQSIMRHSDINLTMSRYTHTLIGQEAKAVENMPDLSKPSKLKAAATGTDGKTDLASYLALQSGKRCTSMDSSGQSTCTNGGNNADSKANGRIRTDNHWFTKPELYR
jgi:integrase